MFTTAGEPSGYELHSVKVARLAVQEIAEVDVNHGDGGAVAENESQTLDDPRQEPMSAIERGTESLKRKPPKTVEIVKEPTYLDMKKKQAALKTARTKEQDDEGEEGSDSYADETDPNDPEFIEYVCIDVE